MRRYRRHHLSDEVEEAIWHYAYGCTCLGMLEEFDGNDELYEAVDNITMAFKNYVYDNVDREDESYAEYKLIQAASEKEMNTDFSGVFQICLNSGNTSWCQNYLNCCSNKKSIRSPSMSYNVSTSYSQRQA